MESLHVEILLLIAKELYYYDILSWFCVDFNFSGLSNNDNWKVIFNNKYPKALKYIKSKEINTNFNYRNVLMKLNNAVDYDGSNILVLFVLVEYYDFDFNFDSSFKKVIEKCYLEAVKYLIEVKTRGSSHKKRIKSVRKIFKNNSVIYYAIKYGNLDIVKYLIETLTEGLNTKEKRVTKREIITRYVNSAAYDGHLDILKYLLEDLTKELNINQADIINEIIVPNNYYVIRNIIKFNKLEVLKYLIESVEPRTLMKAKLVKKLLL